MRKYSKVVLLFFLLISGSCDAGIIELNIKPKVKDTNALMYYIQVDMAEKYIIKDQTDSALYHYLLAFEYHETFNADKTNQLKCFSASENADLKTGVLKYIYQYSDDTITPQIFITRISSFISEPVIEKLQSEIQNMDKKQNLKKINYHEISARLEPLLEKDQMFRIPGSDKDKNTKNSLKQVDKENFKTIMKCYLHYGSYSTTKLTADAYAAYMMVLLHNFSDKKLQKEHNKFFTDEIYKGNLDAREYADIVDNYRYDSTQIYGMHTMFFVGDSLFVYKLSDAGSRKINSNRKRIFLEDIVTTQQKLIWQWQNEDAFRFGNIWGFETEEKAINLAKDQQRKMGSMIDGFEIFSR